MEEEGAHKENGPEIPLYSSLRQKIPLSLLYGGAVAGMLLFLFLTLQLGIKIGAVFSLLPFLLLCGLFFLKSPKAYALFIFIISYFLAGLSRYVNIMIGITFDGLLLGLLGIILLHITMFRVEWRRAANGLTFMAFAWLVYCFLLLFNPLSASLEAWFTSVRWTAFYLFFIVLLTPFVITNLKDIKVFLYVWSVLTLLAVLKALVQKYIGFDTPEKYWLYVLEGARTHIIYSGVRYFSFFTDAANFAASMGLSMVVFGIMALYFKSLKIRLYFAGVALLAMIGLLLSGTRSAIVVPFIGIAFLVFLSKQKTWIMLGTVAIFGLFIILKFTTLGNSNQYIRRMRTALDPQDASFQVRLENQKKISVYMSDKPFGAGIGLGGGKAKRFAPKAYLSQIATDSWMVSLWVETGVVGLVLYLLMFLSVILYGSYITLFKIRDKLIKGVNIAMVAGVAGVLGNSYANEVLAQFPNGVIVFVCMSVIYISKYIDADLHKEKELSPQKTHGLKGRKYISLTEPSGNEK